MRANEKKIVQHYLRVAYNNLRSVQLLSKQQPRSERFPMASQEEITAQHEFSVLCTLARDLNISNPWLNNYMEE